MNNDINDANIGRSVLKVYYSHSGNTRALAGLIQQQACGDLVEILPLNPYPEDYDSVVNQARQELKSGYRPQLKTTVENIGAYNVMILGVTVLLD